MRTLDCLSHQLLTVASLFQDTLRFLGAVLRSRSALMAENLFLRQQLVLYRERAHQGYRTQGRTPYQTFLDRVKETMTEKAA